MPDFFRNIRLKAKLFLNCLHSAFSNQLDETLVHAEIENEVTTLPRWDFDLREYIRVSGKLNVSTPPIHLSAIDHGMIHLHEYIRRLHSDESFKNLGLGKTLF